MTDPIKMFPKRLVKATQAYCNQVPAVSSVHNFINEIMDLFFPVRMEKQWRNEDLEWQWVKLQADLKNILTTVSDRCQKSPEELTEAFFKEIPLIHTRLLRDAERFSQHDPAAQCLEEIVLCYPGFFAITTYRLAHVLYQLNVPIVPRMISEYAHSLTGIDIHPGASIGEGFYIDHGTGIVIGETTVIGKDVKIYQGVTLGALYVDKDLSGSKRHPTIEDRVIIYAGSSILGGKSVIGHDTIIGGNVWLTESVPPFSTVTSHPEIEIRRGSKL